MTDRPVRAGTTSALDTIAACATPWGHGAIAVVRVSGSDALARAEAVAGRLAEPRVSALRTFRDADGAFDSGLVTCFLAPNSYTGEDVVELSGHGNPLLVERLLRALGARAAAPGEFTRRAFLNGRMDLTRAEAVLQSIEATSPAGLEVARAGMDGAVVARGAAIQAALTDIGAELEAILDYPGEDLLFASDPEIAKRLSETAAAARATAGSFRAGQFAVAGARVVLVGPVNAGKSSLFNALLGRPRALVSSTPGTTRDVIEATLQMDAVRVTLVDTAGDRDTTDEIEAAGVALGREAGRLADLVIRCVPGHVAGGHPEVGAKEGLVVATHADLPAANAVALRVSSVTGAGIPALLNTITARLVGEEPGGAGLLLASARQRDCFLAAASAADDARIALVDAGPAAAVEHVYAGISALAGLSGTDVREGVLDRLFARFCVGK